MPLQSAVVKERVVNLIWRGADCWGETVFDKVPKEQLIGSPGTEAVGLASFMVDVSEEALKSITAVTVLLFISGESGLHQTAAGAAFPFFLLFIGTCGHKLWAGQSQRHI